MEFILSRTSVWDYKYEDKTDEEIIDLLELPKEKFDIQIKEFTAQSGIKNRLPVIKINSLEDLIRLKTIVKEEIIIKNSITFSEYMEIEIYDDYRE